MIRTVMLVAAALAVGAAGPSRLGTAPSHAPTPAMAPGSPAAAPARDGVVAYHLAPAGGAAFDVVMLVRAGAKALRIELPDQSYMLATPATRSLVLVVPSARTVAVLPWEEGPQPLFLVDTRMKFARHGASTIAGQRCTNWEAAHEPGHNMLCVTDDGLVLRNQFQDAQGKRSLVEAFAVKYDAMDPGDFEVPAGFDRLDSGPQPGPGPAR